MALTDSARQKLAIACGDPSVGAELQAKVGDITAANTFSGTQTFSTIVATTGTVTTTNVGASGTAGTLNVFPTTASKGKISIAATDNTSNDTITVTNQAFGQATTLTIRDPLAAAANIEPVLTTVVTLTSAQILALHTTPITVISAPGANKAIMVLSVEARHAGGTAYGNIAAGDDVQLRYTDGTGAIAFTIETTGFLDQTTAQLRHNPANEDGPYAPVANAALVAHLPGAIDTGNFDLILRIRYLIVPTNYTS